MIHTYTITGMTCNNCKASVEKALLMLKDVEDISIDLETSAASINMSKHISIKDFQKALPEKYTIVEDIQAYIIKKSPETKIEEKSDIKKLYPLFIILGGITIVSVLLNYNEWHWTNFMLDFMGLFYVVFSFFKLLDLKGFPESFKMYDPLAKTIPAYGFVYPFIEAALGILFLMRLQIPLALTVTIIILGITTIGVSRALLDKKQIQCACLGTVLKLPMTKATFIENSIMLIMAIVMLLKIYT